MQAVEIKKGIYWVGVIDWNIRNFHGHTYATKKGTTYNAYLIIDEKVVLIDSVMGNFSQELREKIGEIIPLEKIDYLVVNHVEIDHSGAVPEILKFCPEVKVLGTARCKEGLWRNFYVNMDFQVVKTGDTLNLGKRTLKFIEAPMIHWPDSMFTYCPQEELLFPNDAFGQHYATSERFDDEVDQRELMEEAKKYYANILWPLSSVILKKIEVLQGLVLSIKMIAPSHGIIWRKDPKKIINAYLSWAKNETHKKVVIVYETMYGATEKMARKIAQGIISEGISVKLFDITQSERTEIISEMLDAQGFIFGSSTLDNGMLPTLAGFLEFLKGLKPKNRLAGVFGSYGWSGGAVKEIEKILQETGIEIVQPSLSVQYLPTPEELKKCFDMGRDFAIKL
ncbi:MAG: flavodoxin domain-containing protein [Candidatus Omnitrophica bacterium]|nr:flavodoxin domain-containing protein [Candidatus Omnitrophota bacterium]MCM8793696.1 flavodoxin domain-containing protein [Candidatus Omnitrophota bacterium]